VLSQFTPEAGSRWGCLADHIQVPGIYAAGRLDADSEGLLLLTDNGRLQHRLTDPAWGHWRRYWVQVEGSPSEEGLSALRQGVLIQGRPTLQARARTLEPGELGAAALAERQPPIRHRLQVPTAWLEIELREGRNRQVRRMTAAVGLPTLRLIRMAIDLMDGGAPLGLAGLAAGQWRLPEAAEERRLAALLAGRTSTAGPRISRGESTSGPQANLRSNEPSNQQSNERSNESSNQPSNSPGRGGRAGGGKSGRAGGGG
jgi:23S rRNA pseudouridine2457 synthase